MDALARIERDIATTERYEKPVSFAVGAAFALLYLYWQFVYNRWIATYTWMIPFGIGYGIPTFMFSIRATRLDRERRALVDPSSQRELPAARIVRDERVMPVPPTVAPPVIAPRRASDRRPTDRDDDGPQLLK